MGHPCTEKGGLHLVRLRLYTDFRPTGSDNRVRPARTVGSEESHAGTHSPGETAKQTAKWDIKTAVGILTAATVGIVFMSEFLIDTVDPVGRSLSVRPLCLGILILMVGNVTENAENAVAVIAAHKNNVDLTMSLA
jgi:calcium/proton exchanger cax